MTEIKTENLPGYEAFGSVKPQPIISGEITIPAIIIINADTGKITIQDQKQKIKMEFVSIQKAKEWANAVR